MRSYPTLGFQELGRGFLGDGIQPGSVNVSTNDLTTWSVDSVNGLDANPGTRGSPFQTIAKLMTVLAEGDSIGLARGSEWREKITIGSVSDIWDGTRIVAYGTGAAPILRCDDIIPAGSWSKTGGQVNVYQATISKDYSTSEPCTYAAWVNDTQLIKATSLANCDATPGSCFAVNFDANSDMTFYIHSTGSSDPTSDGKTVEVAVRHSGVYGGYATNLIVDGVETRRNFSFGGSIRVGQGSIVRNCTLREGSSHCGYGASGSNWINNTFINCYNGTVSCTMLVINDNTPSGQVSFITGCVFQLTVPNGNCAPMNSHNNVSGTFGVMTIADCTFEGFTASGAMFAMNHCASIVMTNPTFINSMGINGCLTAGNPAGCTMTVTGGTWTNNVAGLKAVNMGNTYVPTYISGMTFNCDATSISGIVFVGANVTLSVTNCVFKSSLAAGNRFAVYAQTCASAVLTLNNNTYHTGTGSWTTHYQFQATASGMTWTSDNNTFESTNDAWSIFGTGYSTLATYQAAVAPNDANSISI